MRLNKLSPGKGAKKDPKRVGRGSSAGQGKTAGRGVKGQRARAGGYHKVGFEGGQMPLQRRLLKHLIAAQHDHDDVVGRAKVLARLGLEFLLLGIRRSKQGTR